MSEEEIKTDYIREFENIAGKDYISVGAYYYLYYDGGSWSLDNPMQGNSSSREV